MARQISRSVHLGPAIGGLRKTNSNELGGKQKHDPAVRLVIGEAVLATLQFAAVQESGIHKGADRRVPRIAPEWRLWNCRSVIR